MHAAYCGERLHCFNVSSDTGRVVCSTTFEQQHIFCYFICAQAHSIERKAGRVYMMGYHQERSIVYHIWPFWLSTQCCGVEFYDL